MTKPKKHINTERAIERHGLMVPMPALDKFMRAARKMQRNAHLKTGSFLLAAFLNDLAEVVDKNAEPIKDDTQCEKNPKT